MENSWCDLNKANPGSISITGYYWTYILTVMVSTQPEYLDMDG